MKILTVNKETTYYVETDDEEYPYYRCNENGNVWENLMGESWEPVYDDAELKGLFFAYCREHYDEVS